MLMESKRFSTEAFKTISLCSLPKTARDRNPKLGTKTLSLIIVYEDNFSGKTPAMTQVMPEFTPMAHSKGFGIGKVQTVKTALPFLLRLRRTLRPPGVDMRALNPWTFLRLILLGW